jgi:Fe-Mn family superoxide dismutase
MNEFTVKPLPYQELPGFLTAKQLSEHHDVLYAGYVKKVNEIRATLASADLASANASYSQWRELKIEEGFAVNGVILHEMYFDSLMPGGSKPDGKIKELLERDFGSVEKWAADAAACGMSARGWVVLSYDPKDGRLHNYVCDLHNQGGIWGAIPLLVIDVYEHAYFLDYATARKKYLDSVLANLNWATANRGLELMAKS